LGSVVMRNPARHPARPLNPDEQALFAEWLAAAGDVGRAYISRRRGDPAALQHRIVITTGDRTEEPAHLVYALSGRNIWVVLSSGSRTRVKRFASLRGALNSIRPVLVEGATIIGGRWLPGASRLKAAQPRRLS
jgi:hypothetical protein